MHLRHPDLDEPSAVVLVGRILWPHNTSELLELIWATFEWPEMQIRNPCPVYPWQKRACSTMANLVR